MKEQLLALIEYFAKGRWRRHSYHYEYFKHLTDSEIPWDCERCRKPLTLIIIRGGQYQWVVNHKDKNHFNNVPENLELLCWKCHHIFHSSDRKQGLLEAWKKGQYNDRVFTVEGRKRNSDSRKKAWAEGKYDNRPVRPRLKT